MLVEGKWAIKEAIVLYNQVIELTSVMGVCRPPQIVVVGMSDIGVDGAGDGDE
jgi:hypothetical protein